MVWIVIPCIVTLSLTIAYLIIRGASDVLVPSAFVLRLPPAVDSKRLMSNIYNHQMPGKQPMSLTKKYRLRSGEPVVGLIFEVQDPERQDGFNWQAWYEVDGKPRCVWVNHYGQWSNNPYAVTQMDLIEVGPDADE